MVLESYPVIAMCSYFNTITIPTLATIYGSFSNRRFSFKRFHNIWVSSSIVFSSETNQLNTKSSAQIVTTLKNWRVNARSSYFTNINVPTLAIVCQSFSPSRFIFDRKFFKNFRTNRKKHPVFHQIKRLSGRSRFYCTFSPISITVQCPQKFLKSSIFTKMGHFWVIFPKNG